MIGKTYGKLTVLEHCGYDKHYNKVYRCMCECGNGTITRGYALRQNKVKSCGCLRKIKPKQTFTKHGLRHHPLYTTWVNMRRRCNNINDCAYKNYGGRGIKVCEEWNTDFKCFYDWAMSNGYQDNLTIDRIDNDGNYEPSNCRWVDLFTQGSNKRNNHFITIDNETHTLFQWGRIYNIKPSLILCRIKRGWSEKDAITKPIKKKGK